ncbi:MAG: toxic anion resistance protein [Oscillospiraceae bacterium]
MSEELKVPELSLDVEPVEADLTPTLTLDTEPAPQVVAPTVKKPEEITERVKLSPAEQKQVDEFAKTIDLHNTSIVVQYGSGAQKKMMSFSEGALKSVRSKDLGEVGQMLSTLVNDLRGFDVTEEEKGGFLGLFKKASNKIANLQSKYASAEKNVEKVAQTLEGHQITLMKDIAMLDKMYEQNVLYFKEITMYIMAGKKKLQEAQETELPALRQKAEASGLPEDAQAVNDLVNLLDRFDKKLYDLELTRTISIQMAPQIRLIQNNDTLMSEKIQSTLVNTIPLWKNQMVLALGMAHSQQAAQAQREVTDMTNELLRRNSEALKTATIETARESERGIVEIETLQQTNQNLIETLDEVVRIQDEGRAKRGEAEVELTRIESDLKNKLLEMRN